MTLDYVKREIEYYTGKKVSDDEAKEILWHVECSHCSLEQVISDYYSCC